MATVTKSGPAKTRQDWILAILGSAVLALLIHAPRLGGIIHETPGVDFCVHYHWVQNFVQALNEGVIYPRWVAGSYGGLGSPDFIHYFPLYYYVTALLQWIVGDIWSAMKGVEWLASFLLGVCSYWLARELHLDVKGAVAASAFLQVAPMFMINLWEMAFFPWYLSNFLVVLTLLFSWQLRDRAVVVYLPLSVTVALLAATHLLAAYMMFWCVPGLLLGGLYGPRGGLKKVFVYFVRWLGSCLAGLLLSCFYLWPALTTLDLVTPAGYAEATRWPDNLTFPFFLTTSWRGIQWGIAGALLLTLLFCATALWHCRAVRTLAWWAAVSFFAVAALALFWSSPLAYYFWRYLPTLSFVQFPYRFLQYASAAAVMAALLVAAGLGRNTRGGWLKSYLILPLMLLVGLGLIIQAKGMFLHGANARGYIDRICQKSTIWGQPEYIPATNRIAWFTYVHMGGFAGECTKQGVAARALVDRVQERAWEITAPAAATLTLPLFAYPAWELSVDGVHRGLGADPVTGLVRADIAPGTHQVRLRWKGLPEEIVGRWLSLAGALLLAGAALVNRRLDRQARRQDLTRPALPDAR